MDRKELAENILHQAILTSIHDVSMNEKINHIFSHYLTMIDAGDVPGALRAIYITLMARVDDFINAEETGVKRNSYYQTMTALIDLHREMVRWNALENYILSSGIAMMHR